MSKHEYTLDDLLSENVDEAICQQIHQNAGKLKTTNHKNGRLNPNAMNCMDIGQLLQGGYNYNDPAKILAKQESISTSGLAGMWGQVGATSGLQGILGPSYTGMLEELGGPAGIWVKGGLPESGSDPDAKQDSNTSTGSSGKGSGNRINDAQRIVHFGEPGTTSNQETYETPWGITVTVHKVIKDQFAAGCEAADKASKWKPKRIDSYAKRRIRGGSGWSLHSWPLAWDIFATGPNVPPPGGVWDPDNGVPEDFGKAFEDLGFTWGKRWDRVDVPHIEWADVPPK